MNLFFFKGTFLLLHLTSCVGKDFVSYDHLTKGTVEKHFSQIYNEVRGDNVMTEMRNRPIYDGEGNGNKNTSKSENVIDSDRELEATSLYYDDYLSYYEGSDIMMNDGNILVSENGGIIFDDPEIMESSVNAEEIQAQVWSKINDFDDYKSSSIFQK